MGLSDCDKKAICVNTSPAYTCKCKEGFQGTGKNGSCTGTQKYFSSTWLYIYVQAGLI